MFLIDTGQPAQLARSRTGRSSATAGSAGGPSSRVAAASSLTTILTVHPSLAHTRALAIAISELLRFMVTVSKSRSATISNAMYHSHTLRGVYGDHGI